MPEPTAAHDMYGKEIARLLDQVLASDLVSDRAAVERQVVRVVGVLVRLHQSHQVDEQGRCSICWPVPRTWWRPWPRRSACTVHTALSFYLRQPDRFVLAAITGKAASVRGAS
ncbi:MAG: hypothetical protein ACRDRR_12255 [Pseudonocardiaceae bacterium]